MISRVADTIYGWGKADDYFKTDVDAWAFRDRDSVSIGTAFALEASPPVACEVGVALGPGIDHCLPTAVSIGATRSRLPATGCDLRRHEKGFVLGPPVRPLGRTHLVGAERGAVGRGTVLLGGSAPGDVGTNPDQGRPAVVCHRRLERCRKGIEVVAVIHLEHSPAIGGKTRRNIL